MSPRPELPLIALARTTEYLGRAASTVLVGRSRLELGARDPRTSRFLLPDRAPMILLTDAVLSCPYARVQRRDGAARPGPLAQSANGTPPAAAPPVLPPRARPSSQKRTSNFPDDCRPPRGSKLPRPFPAPTTCGGPPAEGPVWGAAIEWSRLVCRGLSSTRGTATKLSRPETTPGCSAVLPPPGGLPSVGLGEPGRRRGTVPEGTAPRIASSDALAAASKVNPKIARASTATPMSPPAPRASPRSIRMSESAEHGDGLASAGSGEPESARTAAGAAGGTNLPPGRTRGPLVRADAPQRGTGQAGHLAAPAVLPPLARGSCRVHVSLCAGPQTSYAGTSPPAGRCWPWQVPRAAVADHPTRKRAGPPDGNHS
jgi:hypothetical protein